MAALAHKAAYNPALKSCGDASAERPIDLVHLSRQSLGDRALESELLSLFDCQAAQIIDQINAAGAGSAIRLGRDLAHTLKGSARAIGAAGVAAAAQAYEDALGHTDAGMEREELARAVDEARLAIAELLG